ncbi:hypothetical protein [Synechococcus sp. CS-602]|uniref:hypothetical protein n=2 Tax=Synechococcus TaxID=1129 RepID=UPI0037DA6B8D
MSPAMSKASTQSARQALGNPERAGLQSMGTAAVNKAAGSASSGQPARAAASTNLDTSNPAATKPARGRSAAVRSAARGATSKANNSTAKASGQRGSGQRSAEQRVAGQSDVQVSAVISTYLLTHLHHILQRAEYAANQEGHQPLAANYAQLRKVLCLDARSMEVEDTSAVAHLEVEPPCAA